MARSDEIDHVSLTARIPIGVLGRLKTREGVVVEEMA